MSRAFHLVSQSAKEMRRPDRIPPGRSPRRRLYFFGSHATRVDRRQAIDGPPRNARAYADTHEREDCETECGRNHSERSHRSAATGRPTADSAAGKGRTAASRAPPRGVARNLRRGAPSASRRRMALRCALAHFDLSRCAPARRVASRPRFA